MSTGLPSAERCRALLERHAHWDDGNEKWRISGTLYSEQQALKIAEYCVITGQELTAHGTVDGFLNLARRIVALEQKS